MGSPGRHGQTKGRTPRFTVTRTPPRLDSRPHNPANGRTYTRFPSPVKHRLLDGSDSEFWIWLRGVSDARAQKKWAGRRSSPPARLPITRLRDSPITRFPDLPGEPDHQLAEPSARILRVVRIAVGARHLPERLRRERGVGIGRCEAEEVHVVERVQQVEADLRVQPADDVGALHDAQVRTHELRTGDEVIERRAVAVHHLDAVRLARWCEVASLRRAERAVARR